MPSCLFLCRHSPSSSELLMGNYVQRALFSYEVIKVMLLLTEYWPDDRHCRLNQKLLPIFYNFRA